MRNILFTDHFSGPGRTIGLVYVRVSVSVRLCVRAIIFELNDILSRYLACWFN